MDKLVEALLQRAGLLQSPDGRRFEFAYRFEEFLAGCHLANRDAWVKQQPSFVRRARDLLRKQGDYARQVIIWAAGVNAHVQIDRSTVRELVSDLTPRKLADSGNLTDLELAADIARDAGMNHWQDEDVPDSTDTVSRLRTRLEEVRGNMARFDAKARARAASAIGRLGDPRPGVGLDEKRALPKLEWTEELGAGEFTLAEKKQAVRIERPYQLSRYPVTVAQFQAFVDAKGYQQDQYWATEGRAWRDGQAESKDLPEWYRDEYRKLHFPISGPEDFDPAFQTPNHPRVGVSWHEAMAFCAWLGEKLNLEIRLPHEAEWEQAARWNKQEGRADDRRFPWGDSEKDLAQRCNMSDTGIGQTSAVGLFPSGHAECGATDMSGNVWEWCENWYDEKNEYRVLRGGSFNLDFPETLSCSFRINNHPDHRYNGVGFRVVCAGVSAR